MNLNFAAAPRARVPDAAGAGNIASDPKGRDRRDGRGGGGGSGRGRRLLEGVLLLRAEGRQVHLLLLVWNGERLRELNSAVALDRPCLGPLGVIMDSFQPGVCEVPYKGVCLSGLWGEI